MRKLAYTLALLVAVGLLAAGGTMTGGAKTGPGIAWDLNLDPPADTDFGTVTEVLTPGTGLWDDILWGGAPNHCILHNGTYYLYYTGSDNYDDIGGTVENRAIGVATSTDGINFTKYAGNPIITYTTTAGVEKEEGANNAVVAVDSSGTWHMWYSASRYTGPSAVDVDIRYRTSTDGLTWTGDTLVYSVAGEEYIPIAVFYDGTNWQLYYIGNLTSGAGALRKMSGSDPSSLGSNALVLAGTWRPGGAMHVRDADNYLLAIAGGASAWAPNWRNVASASPGSVSASLDNYSITGFAKFTFLLDRNREEWKLYHLDVGATYCSGDQVTLCAVTSPDCDVVGGTCTAVPYNGSVILRTAPVTYP